MNINNLKRHSRLGEPLADCPVCGSPAKEGYNMHGCIVYCTLVKCEISLGPCYNSLSRENLARLWNSIERVKNEKCETTTDIR
jgi:hypothetical protein